MQSYAEELSTELQKVCVNEQLGQHKGIKGQTIEAESFNQYCACESNYIMNKSTKEQLDQISKKQSLKPSWLSQLKAKALKSCLAQEKKITT